MKPGQDEAWDEYWARETRGGKRGGCLPEGSVGTEQAQREVWRRFAKRLDRGARVLDLATGDGCVMAYLLETRRDLKPVGIDLATRLPPPPRGAQVRTGIRMCDLPFPDNRFAAVTSQFGFEYGDMQGTAAEVARVLRPGGLAAMMTHRADGPIVAHNRERRRQIEWAIDERDLPGVARRSLQLRQVGIATIPREIATAPAEGSRLFGERSAAWEIAEAVHRTLAYGQRGSPTAIAGVLDEIVAKARNEAGRIASLEAAAAAAGDRDKIPGALIEAGLELVTTEELLDGRSERPFADLRMLKLPG
jgi:SAM-dependent methyltransferase